MRSSKKRNAQGFTLIELMITVALIGILSATAITTFSFLQLRSRRSEATANLAAIRTHQLSFFHETGAFVNAAPSPGLGTIGTKQNWYQALPSFSSVTGAGFDILAFSPEGSTYYDYDTVTAAGSTGFTAAAYGDSDGDGNVAVFAYFHPDQAGATFPTGILGFPAAWNPATCQPILDTVAPIPFQAGCGFPLSDDY
ncbi:MAG: prepilin-type N-terminal cleavage/methylation domain-containing protein [Myxococcota bacterium]|nr:prepilin-type N-terminal cleavage/methylation domain-containing protein [Myxococcota bacterium]